MRFLLVGWALMTLAGLLQSQATAFTIGVLRRDALIIPFATHDGKGWKNYWPAPGENEDIPLSVRSVSKAWWGPVGPRETWQVWIPEEPPRLVKVRQPDWASSYCHKAIGLRTDYQPRFRPPPLSVNPYPKDGLAVSPSHPVERIEIVGPAAAERDDVLEGIHRRFVELEQELVANLPRMHAANPQQIPDAPSARELLSMPPLTLEALYAYGASRRTYFVEGAREYKKNGACAAVVLVRGMIGRESGRFSTEGMRLALAACDRSTETYMLPLGVMSLPTGTFWIAQISGWDRESYSIMNISKGSKANDQVMPGGGC